MRSSAAAAKTAAKVTPMRRGSARPLPAAVKAGDAAIPLSQRAMTVRLVTHRWTAQKRHRQSEEQVAETTGTDRSRHKHTIVLLADASMKKISEAFSAAETFHYKNTSPWEDGGLRALSNRRFSFYIEGMAKLQREVDRAVAEFAKVYPQLVEHERANNKLFREADYPSPREIKTRFGIEIVTDSIPNRDDFRVVGIAPEDSERIRAQIEARTEQKLKGIVGDLWKRTHECVFRISDRLKAYEEREERLAEAQAKADRRRGKNKGKLSPDVDTRSGTFTDTMIKNLRELVEIIPDLDLTDDPELAIMRQRMQNELCLHDTEDLRQSPALRKRVTEKADEVLAEIDARMKDLGEFLA